MGLLIINLINLLSSNKILIFSVRIIDNFLNFKITGNYLINPLRPGFKNRKN